MRDSAQPCRRGATARPEATPGRPRGGLDGVSVLGSFLFCSKLFAVAISKYFIILSFDMLCDEEILIKVF